MYGSEDRHAVELYERHHRELWRYLARFTGDADQAADIVQETFMKLLQKPPTSAPRVWLFRVATNLARDVARVRTRRRQLLLAAAERLPHADQPPTPDEALERAQRRHRVQRALLGLSDKERAVLLMTEEGFRQREIAEAIGTTTGSVGTLVARAARKLEKQLQPVREE